MGIDLNLETNFELDVESAEEHCDQVLIIFSAPLVGIDGRPFPLVSVTREIESLLEAFAAAPTQLQVLVEVATMNSLREAFSRRVRPTIIHFVGHGMYYNESAVLA